MYGFYRINVWDAEDAFLSVPEISKKKVRMAKYISAISETAGDVPPV